MIIICMVVHSAPDIAGTDKANPLALILRATMMLRYDLDREVEATILEHAVEAVLDMKLRTADIKQEGDGCKLVGVSKWVRQWPRLYNGCVVDVW
jgi:3-isopropylmalate dehydrogenase